LEKPDASTFSVATRLHGVTPKNSNHTCHNCHRHKDENNFIKRRVNWSKLYL